MPSAHDRFLVEPQDFGVLFDDEQNDLRIIAQKWRVSFGHFDPNLITLAMRSQLLPRLAIIGVKPRQKEPVWRFIGYGHRWMGSEYPHIGVGEKVANIPDKDYGEWASAFYQSVAEFGPTPIRPDQNLGAIRGRAGQTVAANLLRAAPVALEDPVRRSVCNHVFENGQARPSAATSAASWDDDPSDNVVVRKFAMSS